MIAALEGIVALKLNLFLPTQAPCVLSEDGTALQPRLEACPVNNKVMVYGLNNTAYECSSVEELDNLIATVGIGRTVYVYTLVPLVEYAPFIPLAVIVHDNSRVTFDERRVWGWWQALWRGCAEHSIHIVGHVSDGDSRLRSAMVRGFLKPRLRRHLSITVDHVIVEMAAPLARALGTTVDHVMCNVDWLHILWRLRLQFLDGKRYLQIGTFGAHKGFFIRVVRARGTELGLLQRHLDVHNKQDYEGAMRLADLLVRLGV